MKGGKMYKEGNLKMLESEKIWKREYRRKRLKNLKDQQG